MAHLGKNIKEKHLLKVGASLSELIDSNEEIVALFSANQFKPQTDGIAITNKRLLTLNGVHFGKIKVVNEIVSDDNIKFAQEKSLGKSTKLIVISDNGEKMHLCTVSKDDYTEIVDYFEGISGSPQSIKEKIVAAKEKQAKAHKATKAREEEARSKQKELDHQKKKEAKEKRLLEKRESKRAKEAAVKARGKEIGKIEINYVGGYSSDIKSTRLGYKLRCYENEVVFAEKGIRISAKDIVSFEVTGKELTTSRLGVVRMVTLGVFSLAAPVRSTKKEASVYIGLKDGRQVLFHTNSLSESEVHAKLASAISHYSSIWTTNSDARKPDQSQHSQTVTALEQYAELKRKGVITDQEFEAKKKQLLGM